MAKRRPEYVRHEWPIDGYHHAGEPDCRCGPTSAVTGRQMGDVMVYTHREVNPNTGIAVEDEQRAEKEMSGRG